MAFLKFSRDKYGYENFFLVEPVNRGKSRTRLLYWFRTPPNARVGRAAFDPDVRRMLEAQNPDISFDWAAIVRTPIPAVPEAEHWRERRRAERAARAAASTEDLAASTDTREPRAPAEVPEPSVAPAEIAAAAEAASEAPVTSNTVPGSAELAGPEGVRRRRRRRRGRRRAPAQGDAPQVEGGEDAAEVEDAKGAEVEEP